MIREEYDFCEVQEYLYDNNDLLILGYPRGEERSIFFFNLWNEKKKDLLLINRTGDDSVEFEFYSAGQKQHYGDSNLSLGIPNLFRSLKVEYKNILLDLSSLDHILIMFITKVLIKQVIPKTLFASYIRPELYSNQSESVEFSLCDQVLGVKSVPGFIKRESSSQILCSFIGFEGVRLKGVIESINNIQKIIPIVAFPVGAPQWYNVTMWNSMDTLQSEASGLAIQKCYSESIFEAIRLLESCLNFDDKIVLAPLGTRPHSMACAIYASKYSNARIVHDYVVESEDRASGIEQIIIYHLSSFLST